MGAPLLVKLLDARFTHVYKLPRDGDFLKLKVKLELELFILH